MMMPRVLTIAGFDPVSGAGITADIKTAAAFRCYGLSIISAMTVQDSSGVSDVRAIEADLFRRQMEQLLSDVEVDAVKIGIILPVENIKTASRILASRKIKNIVLDPILVSSSGYRFHGEDGIAAIKEFLFPLAEIVTPNLMEASLLSGTAVSDLESMKGAARQIHSFGARNVVIKGGHLEGMATDLFFEGKRFHLFDSPRTKGVDVHGLGCAFSMAIACHLAKGESIYNSVDAAKKFVRKLLSYPVEIGKGRAVLDHTGR